jgi:hypothetical protein
MVREEGKLPDDQLVMERIVFATPDPMTMPLKSCQWCLQ